MISELEYTKIKMAKKQETGPFGQYQIPEKPRFRFDPELSRAVSLVPDIEIVSEYRDPINGGGHVYTDILFKGQKYCLFSYWFNELLPDGSKAFRFSENEPPAHMVWHDVKFLHFSPGGFKHPIEYQIENLEDRLTSLIMEYLAVNRHVHTRKKTSRVIFDEKQPIEIKNWEVV